MIQLKEFDIILDIKTKEVKYRDPVSGQKLDEIEVIKGDYKSTRLNIFLESGKQPYIIGDNTVEVVFEKYDKTVVIMDKSSEGFIVEENVIKTTLSTNITAISGRQVKGEVVVKGINGEVLTSRANFYFRVYRGILTDEAIASTNEFPLLKRLIDKADELLLDISAIAENEHERIANEEGRIALYGELKALQTTLEDLESNLIDIVNDESTRQENEIARENLKGELELIQAELERLAIKASNSIEDTKEATNKANMARESIDSLSNAIKQNEELRKLAENERAMNTQAISIEEEERKLAEKNRENNFASALSAFIEETERVESEYPERLNKLESIRTHKGDIEPSDTIFWYDTRKEM